MIKRLGTASDGLERENVFIMDNEVDIDKNVSWLWIPFEEKICNGEKLSQFQPNLVAVFIS